MADTTRLLLAANLDGTNVGGSLVRAAADLGVEVRVAEIRRAFAGPAWWRAVNWHLLGHRPPTTRAFNRELRGTVADFAPHLLLTTGVCPVTTATLVAARSAGAVTANYSTDDPWNLAHRSRGFLRSLPGYDYVFTPRRATVDDFRVAGAVRTEYLPFAYDPQHAHPVRVPDEADRPDVLFVGGGDRDRFALLRPLLSGELWVVLHGSYWDRDPLTAAASRGQVGPEVLRVATAAAKINLCLVRRANRDGHVMRTFEIPAVGGCVLAEDTADHREVFADTAVYFTTADELADRAAGLAADPARCAALAAAAHLRVTAGGNTYRDRLTHILTAVGRPPRGGNG